MKTTIAGCGVLMLSACLTGCAGATYKASVSCDTTKKCEIRGEVSGTIGKQSLFVDRLLSSAAIADAAQFTLDISGSTVSYPATGTATITLSDSNTGAVQAAQLFSWYRNGNIIRLSDPNAVNTWAATYGGTADTMKYSLTKFQTDYGIGTQTIAVASSYEGVKNASATSSFQSCTPPGVYTPKLCPQ